ncbi:MAG: AraC family transcriptional regulator [Pseudomonadales bacterium]
MPLSTAITDTILSEQYLSFRSHDIGEAQAFIGDAYDNHSLQPLPLAGYAQGERGHDQGQISLYCAELNAVSLSVVHYTVDVCVRVGELTSIYVFMPLQGQLEISSQGQTYHCQPGEAVVLNAGVAIEKTLRNNYKQLVLKFDPQVVTQQLVEMGGGYLAASLCFEPYLNQTNRQGSSWWRTVNYVVEELRNIDPSSPQQVMTQSLERLLIQNLLCNQPHNHSATLLGAHKPQLRPWYIKQAEEYLKVNAHQEITMSQLAETIGVSDRSLQCGFKNNVGLSPMQYLKEQRLVRAFKRLQCGQSCDSVTDVALACGFRQLGQFSGQYKRRFGESPSATLRHAKNHLYK